MTAWLTDPIEVIGNPAAQGSKRGFARGGKVVMVEMAKGHADWRSAVGEAARQAAVVHGCLDGPLVLHAVFRFPMPASRPKAIRAQGWAPKVSAPDRDKLERAIGDALQAGGLIADDARIVEGHTTKIEVVGWSGVLLRLARFDMNAPTFVECLPLYG